MYRDANQQEIKVGSRVASDMTQPAGVVTSVEAIDCDYDDNLECAVTYGPYVYVQWPEAEGLDRMSGYNTSHSYYEAEEFVFDDIEIVADDWEPDDEIILILDDDTIEEGFEYGEDLL